MPKRWESLDEFRGFAMAALILFSPLFLFDCIPDWVKHANGNGLHLVDLGVPAFLFAVGLSYKISFDKKRLSITTIKLIRSFLSRNLVLIIFGLVGEPLRYGDWKLHWGVLETIGACGIFVLPFMFLRHEIRLALALIMPFLWQLLLSSGYENLASVYDMGGPFSVPAWSSIILLGSVVFDISTTKDRVRIIPDLVFTSVEAFLLTVIFVIMGAPINKHLVTLSYVAIGIAFSSFVFAAFVFKEKNKLQFAWLSAFGKNSLLMYILAGFEFLLIERVFPPSLSLGYVIIVAICSLFICFPIAWALSKKRIYLKL